jgi:LPXTG-motif cell wall-anchored protein
MATRLTLLAVIAAALAAPSAATAGGWATVGFDPPPEALAPGDPWKMEMTILQHGIRPLDGVKPYVIVAPTAGGEQETFPARPTGQPGVYRASVVFESAGDWSLAVDDGFAARHTFPVVQVGGGNRQAGTEQVAAVNAAAATPPSTGGDGPNLLLALGAAVVAALAAGFGAAYLQRRAGGGTNAAGG